MKAVSGAALAAVRFRLQNASFQDRIRESRMVDVIPGRDRGSNKCRISCHGPAPSMRAASSTSCGTSLKKVKSIQTTIGRLTSV